MSRDASGKGLFAGRTLSVSKRYVWPADRSLLLWLGLAAAVLFALWSVVDLYFLGAHFLSDGPLSNHHALLEEERDCSACHTARAGVTAEGCNECHGLFGDELGTYSFASHFVYRSRDGSRLESTHAAFDCQGCHGEHQGREADLSLVADGVCQGCHVEISSFGSDHPEFDFFAAGGDEEPGLHFSHGFHLKKLLEDSGDSDPQSACFSCHVPESDGRSFETISFDRHCESCHLGSRQPTGEVPIRKRGRSGAETLEAALERGSYWAPFANREEFDVVPEEGLISKVWVRHRDPWILENLRTLRAERYPDAGLANLLAIELPEAAGSPALLYAEALAVLEAEILELAARPEPAVQDELASLRGLTAQIRRALRDPTVPLDSSVFRLPEAKSAGADIEKIAAEIAKPCAQCHPIQSMSLPRVEKDQRALRRAHFDHRAHVLQRDCLDCHGTIQVAESSKPDRSVDHSGLRNIPGIDSCRECHDDRKVESRCIDCHDFHPDPSRRAHMVQTASRGS